MAFKLRNPFTSKTVDKASPELMEREGPNDPDTDADGARFKSGGVIVKDLKTKLSREQGAAGASGDDVDSDGGDPAGAAGDGSGDASPEVVQHNESDLEFRQAAGINLSKSDISLGRHSDLSTRGTVGDISLKRTGGEAPAGDGEPNGPSDMEKGTVKFFNEKKEMAPGGGDADQDATGKSTITGVEMFSKQKAEPGPKAQAASDDPAAINQSSAGEGDAQATGPVRLDPTPARAAGEDGGGAPEAAVNTSHSNIKNMSATDPDSDTDALRHDTVKNSIGNIRREGAPGESLGGGDSDGARSVDFTDPTWPSVSDADGDTDQSRQFQTLSNASKEGPRADDDDMTRSGGAVAAADDSPEAATIGHEATHTVQQRAQAATPLAASLKREAGSDTSQEATGRSIPENSVEGTASEADALALSQSNDKEGVVSPRAGAESDEPGDIAIEEEGVQRMSGKIALGRQEDADPGDASVEVSDDGGLQAAAAGEQKKWLTSNFRLRTAAADPDDDGPSTLLDLSAVDESGSVAVIGDPDFDLLASSEGLDPDSDAGGLDVDPDTDADAVEFEEALIVE